MVALAEFTSRVLFEDDIGRVAVSHVSVSRTLGSAAWQCDTRPSREYDNNLLMELWMTVSNASLGGVGQTDFLLHVVDPGQ